jgi:hypothetical protein
MERAAGPLRGVFSGQVLESQVPGSPLDCGELGGGPHPAPELPECLGGEVLPAIPNLEEQRALGVRPARASPAIAAPGQPRDSARWMLCVAGAKLKVSGVCVTSSEHRGTWDGRDSPGIEGPLPRGGLALQGSGERLLLPALRCV